MILISVVIPVFNAEKYLVSCIESLLSQSFSSCEFIFINDGSTDSSSAIIATYQKKDSRIRLLHQENQGVSNARNKGIAMAKGKYLGFVDADDFVQENYLEELYHLINHADGELALCGFEGSAQRFLPDGALLLKKENESEIIDLFVSFLIFGPVYKLYQTEIIKANSIRFPEEVKYGEDLLFNLKYLDFISRIDITSKVLYIYNVGVPNSLAKQYSLKRYADVEIQIKEIESYFDRLKLDSAKTRNYLSDFYYWNVYDSIYALYNDFSTISKKDALQWIDTTLRFHYLNHRLGANAEKPKETMLVRLLSLKNKWLVYYYILFLKSLKNTTKR